MRKRRSKWDNFWLFFLVFLGITLFTAGIYKVVVDGLLSSLNGFLVVLLGVVLIMFGGYLLGRNPFTFFITKLK